MFSMTFLNVYYSLQTYSNNISIQIPYFCSAVESNHAATTINLTKIKCDPPTERSRRSRTTSIIALTINCYFVKNNKC
jgi:hypothetical protein